MIYRSKPASQDEITLYCFIGEAICAVQHVEDALSHSITLKKDVKTPFKIPKSEAERALVKNRSLTLGRAVRLAKKEQLFSKKLLQDLEEFLSERNWLVHKSIAQSRDEWDLNKSRDKLFRRISEISKQGQKLQHSIEEDLMDFSEANGLDMSGVRAELKKYYAAEG